MEILYLLIPMSVLLVFVIAIIFWWSVRSGQFEDLEGPAYRVLMDDDTTPKPSGIKLPKVEDKKNPAD
jgi:cbb3-type cytochrome oxidase maturation protein